MTVLDRSASAAEATQRITNYSAIGTAMLSWTLNDIALIVGIVVTVFMAFVSWYYKAQHLRIAKRLAESKGVSIGENDD